MANERVLVMEDSLVYRELIVNHVLKTNGYTPLVATDGAQGVRMALTEAPDLIITDLRMPVLDGIEVLEDLREAGCDIPVVFTTQYGSEELVVEAFRLGAKDYVIKPFGVKEMADAIDRALTELRLRRERDALTRDLLAANKQLDAERRQLEAVLTNIEDAVVIVTDGEMDSVLLASHAARNALRIQGEVTGKPLESVVRNEPLLEAFEHTRKSAESTETELEVPGNKTFHARVTPIHDVGRVAVMHDITHFKELDRIKTELVSTVSHDLRAPLTSIKGFAALLGVAGSLNDQQSLFVEKIQRGIDSISEMIEDLLDLGRIEAEARFDTELCEIDELVERCVANVQNSADIKQQTLQVGLMPGLPPVEGNPHRLGQAISNLIGNAIKYTPEGGHITVSAVSKDDQILLTVEDDGIGIAQEDLPHIFEKFYRVKSEETDDIIGSGLGLSLVQSIVEKHGGEITVTSELGVGSAFTIRLHASHASAAGAD